MASVRATKIRLSSLAVLRPNSRSPGKCLPFIYTMARCTGYCVPTYERIGGPRELSIGVLSAKYGLIGAVAPIENYDQRMTIDRAASLRPQVTTTLSGLVKQDTQVHLVLGKDYLQSIDSGALDKRAHVHCVEGGIGIKLQQFSNLLSSFPSAPRRVPNHLGRKQAPTVLPAGLG